MARSLVCKRSIVAAVAIAAVGGLSTTTSSQGRRSRPLILIGGRGAISQEVIVRFKEPAPSVEAQGVEQQIDADEAESIAPGLKRMRSRSFDTQTLLDYLRAHPAIAYVEPNYVVSKSATPSDPRFPTLWGLRNVGQTIAGKPGVSGADIAATKAWNVTVGSRSNVVAVIDSGVDYTHKDLAANIWTAPAAFTVVIGGRSITCAAGTHGFNVIARSCYPRDDDNHGTHVAGIIGAVGNDGSGVTGVNWKASIMPLKILDAAGNGTIADAITAIELAIQTKKAFAATRGANVRVLSNSWNGGGFSQALLDEINKAHLNGMLFVASAGNDGRSNVSQPSYPASYKAANLIAVAATDNQDHRAAFSNYGSSVALAAPGVAIQSTTMGNTYAYMSGTSMAVPHVSGAAALVLAKCALDTAGVKRALLDNAEPVGALTGWVATGGRLNVDRALRSCTASAGASRPAAPTGVVATSAPGAGQVTLTWNAAAAAATYNVKKSRIDGGPYTLAGAGLTSRKFIYSGITGRRYYFVVSAVNAGGESADSRQVSGVGK
jgi:subtilisin family serine protease